MTIHSRLAVILHADVMGSTALVHTDERVAHELIQDAFRRFSAIIAAYGGTTHELRGDALVAEFARASDSVAASLAFQAANAEQNALSEKASRLEVRIGVALGEVVIADNTVTGTGVILAQRIEQLAEPGGICVSAAVHEAVPGRLPVEFKSLGDQLVKGFEKPVRVYAVNLRSGVEIPEPSVNALAKVDARHSSTQASFLQNKPSIAVLPFKNLSGDSDQDYFVDGLTEDIITGLSRFRSLFVMARNSTFAYKDSPTETRKVAEELGVRYVLQGGVRLRGSRLRITVQLIDAETGSHLWAERHDRELVDIFGVQDDLTKAIVASIAPEIGEQERERAQRQPLDNLDAWGRYQRGLSAFYSSTKEGLKSAIDLFDQVNETAPTFAPAFAMGSSARWRYVVHFEPDNRDQYLREAQEKAYKAITLDPRDASGFWNAGRVHSMLGQHDVAIAKSEEAVALNPNDSMSRYFLGAALCSAGRSEEAMPHIDLAMQLSPRDIYLTGMLTHKAFVLFDLGKYEEALKWAQRARFSPNPRSMTFALLSAVLIKLGRRNEARLALNALLEHAPGMSCRKYRSYMFGGPEAMGRFADALREAELPE